jgi:hypothetical protein
VGTSRLDATSPGTSKQFQATPGMQNAFKHLAGTRKGRRPLPDAGKVLESILDGPLGVCKCRLDPQRSARAGRYHSSSLCVSLISMMW